MNRDQFDAAVAAAIAEAKETIGEGRPSPARLDHALSVLAQRIESAARDYHLLGLRTVPELAEEWNVDLRSLQQRAQRRHERYGIGRLIGTTWVLAADEIETLRQDMRQGRRRDAARA